MPPFTGCASWISTRQGPGLADEKYDTRTPYRDGHRRDFRDDGPGFRCKFALGRLLGRYKQVVGDRGKTPQEKLENLKKAAEEAGIL